MEKLREIFSAFLAFLKKIPWPNRRFKPSNIDPVRVGPTSTGIRWIPGQRGYFDPSEHPALPAIRDRAVAAFFARLGLEWIPGEYSEILEEVNSPIVAFRKFCNKFGLNIPAIQREEPGEIRRLHQCVGILVQLSVLDIPVPEEFRMGIANYMQQQDYDRAEELLEVLDTYDRALRESTTLVGVIEFAAYQAFAEELEKMRTRLTELKTEDVETAEAINHQYREAWDQFKALCEYIDGQFAWVYSNWPNNAWAQGQVATRDGMVSVKEQVQTDLLKDPEADILEGVQTLEVISTDLTVFIEQIIESLGGEWDDDLASHLPIEEQWEQWYGALKTLRFAKEDDPSKAAVKKIFRKLAMEHHTDKWIDAPLEVQQQHERAFQEITNARDIIERGKPQERT